MAALLQGTDLPDAQRQAVAEKLHSYTGLPVDYLLRADLRVTGGEFSKELKLDEGMTTGRLDSRYKGPDVDPLRHLRLRSPERRHHLRLEHRHQPVPPQRPQVRHTGHLPDERAPGRRVLLEHDPPASRPRLRRWRPHPTPSKPEPTSCPTSPTA